ncbi:hypothetical protein AJ85_09200 [Alkalihalobacillus alcalophilus ATCC 27647 = CGMCC 1.3604]|uniref:Lipoprotein n=1 Tax=Alkalihalobacillus alcalophilus ATCC 27647 = CGMCC 1.3604 TaxID=1218173 RepID=A0A094WPW2_ALKAL|nr:hypothetical protein [Alkalihalobacillus alcalophilus]KGA98851.1 hypothetical protein BALCAV_0201890 [Alkalihalobacillus alcalophilus ATCC 27647 = CGMCC 1.3604]MED1564261.1 hypothetical protein [Alkalihalobacillus alcalophilus]THG90737.1 hypothetical protein AJ85_09200 [Alkalihalobacillus alcalophilus ATCC 27647 = CGMCC 1.3604]
MGKGALNIFFIFGFLVLSACSSGANDEKLSIYFFGDVPRDREEQLHKMIENEIGEVEEEIHISIEPVQHERILVVIAAQEGDLYFIDQSKDVFFDPVGLVPLDGLFSDDAREGSRQYVAEDEETGEEQLFAVSINEQTRFIDELDIELSNAMFAFVDKRSTHIELSKKILEALY